MASPLHPRPGDMTDDPSPSQVMEIMARMRSSFESLPSELQLEIMGYLTRDDLLSLVAASPKSLRVFGYHRRALVERVLTVRWASLWAALRGSKMARDCPDNRLIYRKGSYSSTFYPSDPERMRWAMSLVFQAYFRWFVNMMNGGGLTLDQCFLIHDNMMGSIDA